MEKDYRLHCIFNHAKPRYFRCLGTKFPKSLCIVLLIIIVPDFMVPIISIKIKSGSINIGDILMYHHLLHDIFFSFDIFSGSQHCFTSYNYLHMINCKWCYFFKCTFIDCKITIALWNNISAKKLGYVHT